MKINKTEQQYDCANCLNSHTPLCELCNQITSPSGKVSTPTYYKPVNGERKASESEEISALTAKITLTLITGAPVMLSWIMRYNDLLTKDNT